MSISLAEIERVFQRMKNDGLDTGRPLVWGYFFNDPNPQSLWNTAERLRANGYTVVDVYPSGALEGAAGSSVILYWLHVEKVEIHSPLTLLQRNAELEAVAHEMGLHEYDGFDVGRLDSPPHGPPPRLEGTKRA